MSRFDAIRTERAARPPMAPEATPASTLTAQSPRRTGKKAVSAYFSREMSRALHLLALEQGASLQALMGEAFDDLLRKYGKHPFGER
jgi:hypothetical protein